jgi:N-acetyl-anhydromuramyl-L-alanine amidase AmpD
MRVLRGLALVAVCALAAAAAAQATPLVRQRVGIVPTANFTPAHDRHVTTIVIHVAETSFWGTVRTLRDPAREASAHFVVSHDGEVVQLVDPNDVAWHAGNHAVNETSIGIEHEGFTYVRGSIGETELEASARLVAYLAKRYGLPLDRRHIIGHNEVPDPDHPGEFGGSDHHTDPGPYWPWAHYLDLVRLYSQAVEVPTFQHVEEPSPPSLPQRKVLCFGRSVHSTTLRTGQTVGGLVPWSALACGRRLYRVDFLVDGRLLAAQWQRPFEVPGGWNTVGLADGWHRLTLRAYGPNGYRIRRNLRVRVENRPFALAVAGVAQDAQVAGDVPFAALPSAATRQVELRVDGETVAVETAAPFSFDWDPTAATEGTHELQVSAQAWDGRTAETTLRLDVVHPLASQAVASWLDSLGST